MSGVHIHTRQVRFGECDPAGVVYYPNYFHWFHEAMESWFDEALGLPYATLLERFGFPSIHTEADYKRPCRFGETVDVELRLGHIGGSSYRLDYTIRDQGGAIRTTGSTVCAMIGTVPGNGDHFKAVRIPDDLRARFTQFQGTLSA